MPKQQLNIFRVVLAAKSKHVVALLHTIANTAVNVAVNVAVWVHHISLILYLVVSARRALPSSRISLVYPTRAKTLSHLRQKSHAKEQLRETGKACENPSLP